MTETEAGARPVWDEGFFDVQRELERAGFAQGRERFRGDLPELRDPMAIPGPLYVSNDDACGCGPDLAPNNVILGERVEGEFLFRQPASLFELGQVLEAADANPVRAYSMDGNRLWTPTLVRQWWHSIQPERLRLQERLDAYGRAAREALAQPGPMPHITLEVSPDWRRWLRYIHGPAELYLRRYCFLLEHGRAPSTGDVLPEL